MRADVRRGESDRRKCQLSWPLGDGSRRVSALPTVLLRTGRVLWNVGFPQTAIGAGPSVVNGRIYLSAGYNVVSLDTAASLTAGSQLISYGLEADEKPKVWEAAVEMPKQFTLEQCRSALAMPGDWPEGGKPSAACAACLCECDANAAANCDTCWPQAQCAAQICWFAAAGEDMHNCMSLLCTYKLVPATLFERAVEIAPCATKCAATCGF